jgi:HSP20 family protein
MLPARKFFGQNFMPDFFNDLFDNVSLEGRGFKSPAINVIEDDDRYCIELAAPGMTKDDFKVHLNKDGNLVVELEKKNCGCKDKKECKYLRKEFSYARFTQTLLLPDNADKDGIQASVENGILFIDVPKLQKPKAEEETKLIEIK